MALTWKDIVFRHLLLLVYLTHILKSAAARNTFDSTLAETHPTSVYRTNTKSSYTEAATVSVPHPRHHRKFNEKYHSGKISDWNIQKDLAADNVLYIGGLFELSGTSRAEIGISELRAAQLAVKHINQHGIVPGFSLELLFKDTKCDPGVGTDALYDLIYRKPNMVMVMGSACAEVTKMVAEIVPYWNLILISHAATSPALSEREKYQTFFRLAPGDSSLNPARRMLIQYFRWNTVAILYEDKEKYSLAMNGMAKVFDNYNISSVATLSFTSTNEVPEKMKRLKELDVRILIGGFSQASARQVFCEAYKLGMYGRRYVWLLADSFLDNWWNTTDIPGCTREHLKEATEGYITVSSLNNLMGDTKSEANLTMGEFRREYWENNGSAPMSMYASTTYDTVWTIALTLRASLALQDIANVSTPLLTHLQYEDMKPVQDVFLSVIKRLNFVGVSGPVSFKGSDRESIVVIYQNQDGNFTRIAVLEPMSEDLDFNCHLCEDINWQGGRVPKDKKIVLLHEKTIDPMFFYVSCALCGFGVIAAIFFLAFNLHYRKLRYIKLSSPKLNNVAVVGCILVYSAVILLGVDDATLAWHVFPFVCTARAFLLAGGFSLAFGAMFAKTYRVHQIFTRANSGLIKSKLLQDKHLLFLIGTLLIADSAVVFVWVLVDPMERKVTNLTEEASEDDEDLLYLHQLTTCHSNHLEKWMGAFYAYKGLLLVFGVYMAWETRNVKIPALNDSQYIGMNVYNVVIMSIAVVVLSNILSTQPTLAYAMESCFMFLSTTVTLCLLFVPKMYVILSAKGDPTIASSGILVEANTRRFVFDDRKEIYYRAEVQNRVYKREIIELEQEVMRLERLLELPVEPYPRLTEEMLYLLPESAVDGTPGTGRRRKVELTSGSSISDGGSVSYELEENADVIAARKQQEILAQVQCSEDKNESTFKKFYKLSRSFSIGPSHHLKPRTNIRRPLSPNPKRSNLLSVGHNRYQDSVNIQSYTKRRSDSAIELSIDPSSSSGHVLSESSVIPSVKNNLQWPSSQYSAVPKSPRIVCRLQNNTASKPSILEENEDIIDDTPSSGAMLIPNKSNNTSYFKGRLSPQCQQYGGCGDVMDDPLGARARDVDSAFVKNRALSKLRSTKSIIENERRVRIRRLQTNLVKIQKELHELDELEYEVSQV